MRNTCTVCGKNFYDKRYRYSYCSVACKRAARHNLKPAEICEICGKVFEKHYHRASCCAECAEEKGLTRIAGFEPTNLNTFFHDEVELRLTRHERYVEIQARIGALKKANADRRESEEAKASRDA